MTEYDQQASQFVKDIGIGIEKIHLGTMKYFDDDTEARDVYQIVIRRWRGTGNPLTFRFGDSIMNTRKRRTAAIQIKPSDYHILATLSSDQHCPDNFEDFCSEYGYDQDSRKALKTFKRASKFARRIKSFFNEKELEQLANIQ